MGIFKSASTETTLNIFYIKTFNAWQSDIKRHSNENLFYWLIIIWYSCLKVPVSEGIM